jgi:hypothetical protein
MRFRIEYISKTKPTYIFARQLGEGTFEVNEDAYLGGVCIKPGVFQPRALMADGSPDITIYAFYVNSAADKPHFEVGSIVELQAVSRTR